MGFTAGSVMEFRELTTEDEAQAVAASLAVAPDNDQFLPDRLDCEPWADFVARVNSQPSGLGLLEVPVPSRFVLGCDQGDIVGRVRIRYALTPSLARFGGHIGFVVLPGFRRRGYATKLLNYALADCAHAGLPRVLLTCADDNPASARTIERCGGVLHDTDVIEETGLPERHYWIATSGRGQHESG